MTVAALPGNVRFRAFQLGKATTFGTPVARTRRMPWRFNPTIDPHWTFPDVDTGTLDPAIAPYRMAMDVTGQATGPLAANDAPALWALLLKGGVAPSGPVDSAYTWQFTAAATSSDPFELVTADWGDEVVGDQMVLNDGILEGLQLTYPQDLGPIQVSADFRFASATLPGTATAGLSVDTNPAWLYAADTMLYANDNAGAMGITPLTNTMHDVTVQISVNPDIKRFANGSNANFAVAGYGRGPRTLQSTFTFAKSTVALAEVAKWLNANPQERFLSLDTTTRKLIGLSSYYAQRLRFAGYWFTRSEAEIGSNTGVQLVCNHIYDPALAGGPIDVRVVNGMAAIL